jgi:hypothetical protein
MARVFGLLCWTVASIGYGVLAFDYVWALLGRWDATTVRAGWDYLDLPPIWVPWVEVQGLINQWLDSSLAATLILATFPALFFPPQRKGRRLVKDAKFDP